MNIVIKFIECDERYMFLALISIYGCSRKGVKTLLLSVFYVPYALHDFLDEIDFTLCSVCTILWSLS